MHILSWTDCVRLSAGKISENLHYYSTVNVGGYEPTKVVITLGRGVYTLHLYYYFVVHVHVDTFHTCTRGHIS
jgi:hypothetical protein